MATKKTLRKPSKSAKSSNVEVIESVNTDDTVVSVSDNTPKSTALKTTRIVLDVPTSCLDKFKLLCHLVGETQSSMVTKAMDSYMSERNELLEQFIELRAKISN